MGDDPGGVDDGGSYGTTNWSLLLATSPVSRTRFCREDKVNKRYWACMYRSNLKAMLIKPRLVLPFTNLQEFTETNIPFRRARHHFAPQHSSEKRNFVKTRVGKR
ncbi:hypothetical protein E2C01_084117 [Portunus trituberculatus]|uniref:Uncharacterized protein n=1 Tax=Portunus trituberculatus TaxID=210409 RepID=A0A5B7IZ31_PORTR|nr:hypothetical protein [Portunus trituberculatus]